MLLILAMAAATAGIGADEVAAKNRADLQVLYDQSCAVRAYGSYDDMCNKLRQSIREYERDQAKAARERARAPKGPVAPSPAVVSPSAGPPAQSPTLSFNGN
ncbi:MAG: hypothetical protein ABIO39_08680 [Caulobacteraceae bacterium]